MRDRIAKAVRMRLELNAPYMSGWAQALSLQVRHPRVGLANSPSAEQAVCAQAHPSNAVVALQQRAALFDEIWHFMGVCVCPTLSPTTILSDARCRR